MDYLCLMAKMGSFWVPFEFLEWRLRRRYILKAGFVSVEYINIASRLTVHKKKRFRDQGWIDGEFGMGHADSGVSLLFI